MRSSTGFKLAALLALTACQQQLPPAALYCVPVVRAAPEAKAWFLTQEMPPPVEDYLDRIGRQQCAIELACHAMPRPECLALAGEVGR